jgi:hypothetical protein
MSITSHGLFLTFTTHPPLTSSPLWITPPKDPNKALALRLEVDALLTKRATEIVSETTTPGFYSHLFVVPKPGGRWRPVIDLSALNAYIHAPHFYMETARSVRQSVAQNEYAISIDLSDAYLHVPMAQSSMKYLRFAIDGTVYTFRALPFGLNLAPLVFTRIMSAIVTLVRKQTHVDTTSFIDDILQKNLCPHKLVQAMTYLLDILAYLGWKVNLEKSDLTPSQDFVHLGMHFVTHLNQVKLTDKRIDKLMSSILALELKSQTTPRELQSIIGMCQAAAELIPLGLATLRPVQWTIANLPWPPAINWNAPMPLPPGLLQALAPWKSRDWLAQGVPLETATAQVTLCTDASLLGWGAHLLPEFRTTQGQWSPEELKLHMNVLEFLAVIKAVTYWLCLLRGKAVLIMTDNTTVCAYIRHQGGTRSRILCQRAIELHQLCHSVGITLTVRHIPGRLNVIADSLSRRDILHTEWTLNPEVFDSVRRAYPSISVDVFATRLNHRLPLYVSPFPDELALAIDGLQFDWTHRDIYAYPPTALIPRVLSKLEKETCMVALIAPLQWTRIWTTQLANRAIHPPLRLPIRTDLLLQPASSALRPGLEQLNLHLWRLYGGPSLPEGIVREPWSESCTTSELPR